MYRIAKQFHFSASHQLHGLPEAHPCGRLHGHNYTVTVELATMELDESTYFVRDYGDLHAIKEWIDFTVDHKHLNDIVEHTTAEYLAEWMYCVFKAIFNDVVAVRVSETEKTWAEYRP